MDPEAIKHVGVCPVVGELAQRDMPGTRGEQVCECLRVRVCCLCVCVNVYTVTPLLVPCLFVDLQQCWIYLKKTIKSVCLPGTYGCRCRGACGVGQQLIPKAVSIGSSGSYIISVRVVWVSYPERST